MDAPRSPYQLGRWFDALPIPPVPEHCIAVAAGPLQLVVESRQLTEEIAVAALREQGAVRDWSTLRLGVDDFGATLHVHGRDDGLEHLRFDCFEREPHYHYVRHAEGGNLVCRIDQFAEGDPIRWTLGRLREQLPEMLEFAGVPELAAQARDGRTEILAAVDEVADLLERARRTAVAERQLQAEGR